MPVIIKEIVVKTTIERNRGSNIITEDTIKKIKQSVLNDLYFEKAKQSNNKKDR